MSNPNDFKKLQKEWYKKLEKSGFQDIENETGQLKNYSVNFIARCLKINNGDRDNDFVIIRAKAEYYYKAEHFLTEHKFNSNVEKEIWRLHASGKSLREIGKILSIHYGTVNSRIQDLKKICFKKHEN